MTTLFKKQDVFPPEFSPATFALRFAPMASLPASLRSKVKFNRYEFMTKEELEGRCNENKNKILFQTDVKDSPERSEWDIVWMNNKMPSELDWRSVRPARRIKVEFRVTSEWGRVAILSFCRSDIQSYVSLV